MSSNSQATSPTQQQQDQVVLNYLKKRGFKNPENALLQESNSSVDHFVFDSQLVEGPAPLLSQLPGASEEAAAVIESYQKLQRFIEDSLDLYKSELQAILYPVFVHVFLDLICRGFQPEGFDFSTIQIFTPSRSILRLLSTGFCPAIPCGHSTTFGRHGSFACQAKSNCLTLSSKQVHAANELLCIRTASLISHGLAFHDTFKTCKSVYKCQRLADILTSTSILLKVYSTKPISSMRQDAAVVGITGHTSQQIQSVNQQKVYLGKQPFEPHFQEILETRLKQLDLENKDEKSSLLESFKAFIAQPPDAEPIPRDEAVPVPPPSNQDLVEMIETLNDIRQRVKLSSSAASPSAVTYTFHNTNNSLTCVNFSHDYKMAATGFSDSYIRIWSLTGEPLRSLKASVEYTAADFENVDSFENGCEDEGDMSKRLVGHSGPVYDTSFSHDGKYLISGSEDGTARLWSMHTFTNLVVYRGHNYPIWSVDFGPNSYYFATGSHDRTARIWSCESPHALRIFAGHLSDVECVKFHPNSNYLFTSSADRTVRMWDIHRGKCVRLFTSSMSASAGSGMSYYLPGHPTRTSTILSLAVSPDGYHIASGGDDGSIVVWDLASGRVVKRYGCTARKAKKSLQKKEDRLEDNSLSAVYSLDFSADGDVVAAGYADGRVRVFEVKKGGDADGVGAERDDLLGDFCTKRTPIHRVKFTNRNLLLTSGPFVPNY